MNKRQIQALVKNLDKRMQEVAKVRDKIDDDISQFEQLREDCEKAYDSLQDARDALSELV